MRNATSTSGTHTVTTRLVAGFVSAAAGVAALAAAASGAWPVRGAGAWALAGATGVALAATFVVARRSIVALHAARDDVAARERTLAAIVEGTNDAVFVKRLDGRYLVANAACARLLGRAANDVAGRTDDELVPPEAAAVARVRDREALAQPSPITYEERLWIGGADRSLQVTKGTVRDARGEVFALFGVARDLTEARRAEAALVEVNRRLDRRTAELEAANRELEAFSYSVSHDLRAPLRHISGFVDLLQRHAGAALDATGRRHLSVISQSARHMGQLVDDLLVFARMNRTEMRRSRVRLGQLAAEVADEARAAAGERRIEWTFGDLPEVWGDEAMLRQAFRNLVENAVKYTRPREVAHIEIGTEPGAPDEHVVFVRDDGVGFDMKYVDKLFGVFQRLHRADEFEGTGIGLANVRRIVQRHGGRTWATGSPGAGATFRMSLPRSTEAQGT